MQIDPKSHKSRDIYNLLCSVVIPRPIAWVSSQSKAGVLNLAPFSYFAPVTSKPPLLMISVGRRRGKRKDTANNASSTREFVVNVVTEPNIDVMVQTAGDYEPDISEFEKAGLTPLPSSIVKPPRVKEARIQMECRTHQIFEVSPGIVDMVIGEVVMFHVDDALPLDDQLRIPADAIRPVARLGGTEYAFLGDIVNRDRPKV